MVKMTIVSSIYLWHSQPSVQKDQKEIKEIALWQRKKQRKQFMVLNDVHIHHLCLSGTPCCMYVGGTEDPWNLISQYFQDSDLIFAEQCLHGFVTDVQEDSTGSHLIFAHIVWLHEYTGGDQVDWDNLSSDLVAWLFYISRYVRFHAILSRVRRKRVD